MMFSLEPTEIILAIDGNTTVTPSWFIDGKTRYAVRTITRLKAGKYRPPVGAAWVFLMLGVMLCLFSLLTHTGSINTLIRAESSLLAGLVFIVIASVYLWLTRTRYLLTLVLLDGSEVRIFRKKKASAQALLDATTHAMDWHRTSEMPVAGSRLRRSMASGTAGRMLPETVGLSMSAGDPSGSTVTGSQGDRDTAPAMKVRTRKDTDNLRQTAASSNSRSRTGSQRLLEDDRSALDSRSHGRATSSVSSRAPGSSRRSGPVQAQMRNGWMLGLKNALSSLVDRIRNRGSSDF